MALVERALLEPFFVPKRMLTVALRGEPSHRFGMIINLVNYIQYQREQRHAYQHAVIGLAENCQIWVLVEIIVQLLGLRTGIPR